MGRKTKIVLAILLGNIFIAFLGIGLIIPVLPTIMREMNISGSVVGYMTAAFAITQLIASPFAGRLTDKIGRKIMIVLGLILFGISEFLFGIGKTVEILFISRFLGGVSAAFIMPAVTAYIADITTFETRPKALGFMSAAISTGFIIGPGVGGFLAEVGSRVPFLTAGLLGTVAAILSFIFLKEPKRQEQPEMMVANSKSSIKKIFIPMFFIAFLIIFITTCGLTIVESYISLYTDHKFAFTPKDIAVVVTVSSIIGAIAQLFLFDRMTKWWGEINVIRLSLILSGIFTFVLTQISGFILITIVISICFVGFDLIRPAVTSYLSKIAGDEQGFVGGMNSMFSSLAMALGPILGGKLFDMKVDYPFYASVFLIGIALVMALFWKKPLKEET